MAALNWTVEHILLIANLKGRNVRLFSSSSFSIWVTGFIFNEAYLANLFSQISCIWQLSNLAFRMIVDSSTLDFLAMVMK
jgi:hypothetical protein